MRIPFDTPGMSRTIAEVPSFTAMKFGITYFVKGAAGFAVLLVMLEDRDV